MSIQSSINAAIGSIAAVRKSQDFTKHREAMRRIEETKAAASMIRAQSMAADVERKASDKFQQAELIKARTARTKALTEAKMIKMGVSQDGKQ